MSDKRRVKIVSAAGMSLWPGVVASDPAVAHPHFGKLGWMTEEPCEALGGRKNPRIVLDDGEIVWGFQCWWDFVKAEDEPRQPPYVNAGPVLDALEEAIAAAGSAKALAYRYGLSPQFISDVRHHRRDPGAVLASWLGFKRVVLYSPVKEAADDAS